MVFLPKPVEVNVDNGMRPLLCTIVRLLVGTCLQFASGLGHLVKCPFYEWV